MAGKNRIKPLDNLIQNLQEKIYQKEIFINPISTFLIFTGTIIGFLIYNYYGGHFTIEDIFLFLLFPVGIIVAIVIAGKWEVFIKISFIAFLGYFFWKGGISFYYTLTVFGCSLIGTAFQIVNEWERAIILRFGKFHKLKGPGLFLILPFADTINRKVDLRIRATDFTTETTLTQDSVPVTVDALAFWMIWDAEKAILEVENYMDAVILSAMTALRNAISQHSLSSLLGKGELIEETIRKEVDKKTTEWGITVQHIEITDIIIPEHLQDVMSKKAQAEREKELRVIMGDAEVELAKKFEAAAQIYNNNAVALKLRSMNIILDGLKEGNSMLLVPSTMLDNLDTENIFGIQALGEVYKDKKKKNTESSAGENT